MICVYLKNLKIEIDLGKEILSVIALKNNINNDIFVPIVDEYENNFYLEQIKPTNNTRSYRNKFKKWQRKFVYVLAFEFLNCQDIFQFVRSSKRHWNELRNKLFSRKIIEITENNNIRFIIWKSILGKVKLPEFL